MIGQVTSALAAHLAAGSLFLTAMLGLAHRLPPAFTRFCTAACASLAFVAVLVHPSPLVVRLAWMSLALVSLGWYLAERLSPTSLASSGARKVLAIVAALAAVAAVVESAWVEPGFVPGWLAVAGGSSSSLLLGAVTVSMVLGHWYLVDTGLSIAPLASGTRWFAAAVLARWAQVGAVLFYGGWRVLHVGRPADLIFSTTGLFFLFRSLMGLGAPLILAGLVWQTVKIRSTQSATGLLYVALILVLFGELVSAFLQVLTGYPL